jgi:hypothetical protein
MQEIIQLYAAVADDLYKLDSSSGKRPDPNPSETLQTIRAKLARGADDLLRMEVNYSKGKRGSTDPIQLLSGFDVYHIGTDVMRNLAWAVAALHEERHQLLTALRTAIPYQRVVRLK